MFLAGSPELGFADQGIAEVSLEVITPFDLTLSSSKSRKVISASPMCSEHRKWL